MSAAHDHRDAAPSLAGPHNLDAEMALLGALITNPREGLPAARFVVRPEDFIEGVHGRIFEVMLELDRSGTTPAITMLASALRDDPDIADGVPLRSYLGTLAANATTLINIADYARVVRDLSVARQALAVADGLYADLRGEGALHPFAAVSDAVARCDELLAGKDRTGHVEVGLSEAIAEAVARAEHRRAHHGAPEISTGLTDLNRVLGGLWKGQLVILAGRPSMGKTAFMEAIQLATGRAGHGSATFQYEMDHGEYGVRAASMYASEFFSADRLEYSEFRRGVFTERQRELALEAAAAARDLPIRVIQASGFTVHDVASRCRRISADMRRRGKSLDLVFVDYLQRIVPSNRYAGSRTQEIGEITTALKNLAQQLNVCVVLLSQLSRAVESRDDKRPRLSDLRESGDIEQDADVVLFLYREAYYLEKEATTVEDAQKLDEVRRLVEVLIAKQRMGPLQTVKVFGDLATNVFRDWGGDR